MSQEAAIIINVIVPFERTSQSLHKARASKLNKYYTLAQWLEDMRGLRVSVHALVVGALGSCDPENKSTSKHCRSDTKRHAFK